MTVKRWSHSTLDTLLDGCAWQVYLEKWMREPSRDHPRSAAGTAHHAAVELHERRRRFGGATTLDEGLDAAYEALKETDVDWQQHSLADASEEVDRSVERWWTAPIPEGQPGAGRSLRERVSEWKPLAIERGATVWQAAYSSRPFRFIADGLYEEPQPDGADPQYVLVDQKTVAKDFKRYGHDGGKQLPQASAYTLGCLLCASMPVPRDADVRVEFHVVRTGPIKKKGTELVRVVTVHPSAGDLDMVRRRMRLADEKVAAGDFPKNPKWNLCSPTWCAHHKDAGGSCDPEGPPEFPVDVVGEPLPVARLAQSA